jgi:cold shock CspA family protein
MRSGSRAGTKGRIRQLLSGVITQLLPGKQLGFVRPLGGGIPLLFRASSVEGELFAELSEGQLVTYALERDLQGRGARAVRLRPTDCPPRAPAPGARA